jgi:hypothetical protein
MLEYNGITPSFPYGDANRFGKDEIGVLAVEIDGIISRDFPSYTD